MTITHTLEECNKIWIEPPDGKVLESVLSNFQQHPLTFSEMSQLGVPDNDIYCIFIESDKVPDDLKKQLANFNCQLAKEYCENPATVEHQNKTTSSYEAAWLTSVYLRAGIPFTENWDCLLAEVVKRQADYICQICDGEIAKVEAV